MKNRNIFSQLLDVIGIIALTGAAIAMGAALWFAGSLPELLMMTAFGYCIAASVASFLTARVVELSMLFRAPAPANRVAVENVPDNVEHLPLAEELPRAA